MNKITVVIPTYNNINGLRYLLNYFKDKPYKLIVIDNNPKIKKLESLKVYKVCKVHKVCKVNKVGEFGRLVYLLQERNLGFAKAINLGAKYVDTEWMMILNDDIEFQVKSSKLKVKNYNSKSKNLKNPFEFLINYAEKNKLEAVTPILRNLDGSIENLGYKVLPYGKIKLIKTQNSNLKTQNYNLKLKTENLDGITAACLLIKTKVFKELGGFDESFFAYLEDVEFFIRFKKAGYKFGIAPIEVQHHHMTTSKTLGSFKARQDMINWWRLYFKHPDKFKFDFIFIIERLRNLSGYLKSLFNFYK